MSEDAIPRPGAVRTVLCVYCRGPIAAEAFAYWPTAPRLLSAVCPSCERQVTLPVATWRRQTILYVDVAAAATLAERHG
jgi:hypothetical protein